MILTLIVIFLVLSFICGLVLISACIVAGRASETPERRLKTSTRQAKPLRQRVQVMLD